MSLLHSEILTFSKNLSPDLSRIETLLSRLGNPHLKIKNIIHIAGTNGKGSTALYLQALLKKTGHSVNLFTSPHLLKLNERISFDGADISDALLEKYFQKIKSLTIKPQDYTFFEVMTVVAFLAFSEQQADYTILEVGLGGKFDPTNIIEKSLLTILTPISQDHADILGDSLLDVAFQKAGIIKPLTPVLIGFQSPEILSYLEKYAYSLEAPLLPYVTDWTFDLGFLPDFQQQNATLALSAAFYLLKDLDLSFLCAVFKDMTLKGRFQKISPSLYVDVAHNEAGAKALFVEIKKLKNKNLYQQIHLYICLQKNKNLKGFLLPFIESHGIVDKIFLPSAGEVSNFYAYKDACLVFPDYDFHLFKPSTNMISQANNQIQIMTGAHSLVAEFLSL